MKMFDVFCIYFGLLIGLFAVLSFFYALYYFVKIVRFFTSDDNEQVQEKGEHK